MNQSVVVTGMGICCSIGNNVGEVIESLRQAKSGLKPYECSHAPNLTTKFAGTIEQLPPGRFPDRLVARWDRGTLLAAHAASQALDTARLNRQAVPSHRLGLATGASGSGQFHPKQSNPMLAQTIDRRLSKLLLQQNVPCFQTDELARHFGFQGPIITVSSASAGSGIAIGAAMRWLQTGQADFVLAGGGEGLLPLNIIGFDFLGILDAQPCSPFSRSQGMSMGEGAAFLTIERYESAIARQAPILGYLHGHAVTSDAFDSIQFDPSGDGIRRALEAALVDAQLHASDIDWIKSSGAGGASQDASEIAAIRTAFGEHKPVISSFESTLGHCNGAGPAMGLVTSLACQQQNLMPATLNFDEQASTYEYDFVPNRPRQQTFHHFVATTAAFGGTNVVLAAGDQPVAGQTSKPLDHEDPIVISGIGLVTALGCGQRELAGRLLDESCQWSDLSRLESDATRVTQAGLVRGFEARKLLSSFKLRGIDLLTQYAAAATKLALQDAAADLRKCHDQVGLVTGIARASGQSLDKLFQALEGPWGSLTVSKALLRKGRFLLASQLANWFGMKGYSATITDGLTTSLRALTTAVNQLRCSPDLQSVVVVAADEVSASGLRLLEPLGVLHHAPADQWQPYGETDSGMIVGEGAVALVVERESTALRRGCVPIASILACANTFDAPAVNLEAQASSQPSWIEADSSGRWLEEAIVQALESINCPSHDIDLVIGNGCGLTAYDTREANAVRQVIGPTTRLECVTKNTGVLEAAGGLMGVAAASMQLAAQCTRVPSNQGGSVSTAERPTTALVIGSSEIGRNTALVLRSLAGSSPEAN